MAKELKDNNDAQDWLEEGISSGVAEELSSTEKSKILFTNLINGISVFIASYFIMYLVYHIATGLMVMRRQWNATMFYHRTDVFPFAKQWISNPKSVVWIYATGPVVCLIVAAIAGLLYFKIFRKRTGIVKFYFLWIQLIGAMFFFGGIGAGIMVTKDYRGMGYALAWGGVSASLRIIFLILSVLLMLIVGFLVTRSFLQTAQSRDLVRRRGWLRFRFMLFNAFLPFAIGSVFVTAIRYPLVQGYDMISLLFIIPSLIAMFSFGRAISRVKMAKAEDRIGLSWGAIAFAIILTLGVRVGLQSGIPFETYDKEESAKAEDEIREIRERQFQEYKERFEGKKKK